jgi:hypothetical protein
MESRQPMPINDRLNQQYRREAASRKLNNKDVVFSLRVDIAHQSSHVRKVPQVTSPPTGLA